MNNSKKCNLYKNIKPKHKFEQYILKLPKTFLKVSILKIRSCNRLPTERGRYSNIPRERRYCELRNEDRVDVGDEYDFYTAMLKYSVSPIYKPIHTSLL